MPTILPISDLRNYSDVLHKVDVDKPVYLTRNGLGTYVISKIDDYNRDETAEKLLQLIQEGEKSIADGEIRRRISQAPNHHAMTVVFTGIARQHIDTIVHYLSRELHLWNMA